MALDGQGPGRGSAGTVEPSQPPASQVADDGRFNVLSRIVRGFDSDQLRDSFSPGGVEHRLLGPGSFDAHLMRVNTAKLALQFIRYSLPVAVNGAWPEDWLALAFAYEVPDGALVHGQPFPSCALVVLDCSTGIELRLSGHSTCAILIVRRGLFESALSDSGVAAEFCRAVVGTALRVREADARRLKGLLRTVLDDVELAGQALSAPALSLAFERDVLKAFARALAATEGWHRKGLGVLERRNRLVKKAEAYVVEHLDESVRMERLCREVGASPRALEYAFQAVYGMGAMRYLRTIRLNEVRRALLHRSAARTASVTSAAMEWGFWHLGEFAAAYRRLFGEPPSETLRTAASKHGVLAGAPVGETSRAGLSATGWTGAGDFQRS